MPYSNETTYNSEGVQVNVPGHSFKLNGPAVRNLDDAELARFCRDSNDPLVRELARRLEAVAYVRR